MKIHRNLRLKKKLLIMELPQGRYHFPKNTDLVIVNKDKASLPIHFPDGYTLLGKPDEIKEDDVMEVVDKKEIYTHDGKKYNHVNTITALESFFSAIESEIYWVNPYEIPSSDDINWYRNQINGDFSERYTRVFDWYEAQSRTFDRNRTLIFVEN